MLWHLQTLWSHDFAIVSLGLCQIPKATLLSFRDSVGFFYFLFFAFLSPSPVVVFVDENIIEFLLLVPFSSFINLVLLCFIS